MQGSELKRIREGLGLDRVQFARLLGYTGTDRNDETRIRRYENQSDQYQIPLYIARLAWLIGCVIHAGHISPRSLRGGIDWPRWPGYDFSHEADSEHAG